MQENNKKQTKSVIISVIALSIFTAVTAFMLIAMQSELSLIVFWISLPTVVLLGCSLIVMSFFGHDKIVKLGVVILVAVLFVVGVFYFIYEAGYFSLLEDVDALRSEIAKTGSISVVFVLLQFAQVCILPIPATVTTVLGLLLFTPFDAIVLSLIGMISGACVMFLFGKYAGRKAVDWALGKEDVAKYINMAHGKHNAILTAMFLLPIFPDDIICAIAGILGMNGWYFFIVLSISRILSTVVSVLFFSGNFIPLYGWWLGVWAVLIAILVGSTVLYLKNIEKVEIWITKFTKKFERKRNFT